MAQSLNEENNPYGFSKNCNTHMMKNSEWGAAAYLTQSNYGRNGTEIVINNYLTPKGDSRPTSMDVSFCAKTGYGAISSKDANASDTDVALYNTEKGVLASTTGNIYGVYDMVGGSYEYVSAYAEGLNGAGYNAYKSTEEYYNEYGSYLLKSTNGKMKSMLSINRDYSSQHTGRGQNENFLTHSKIFGDAMWEVSQSGNSNYGNNWNSDYRAYPSDASAFLGRGGYMSGGSTAGVFCFCNYAR